MLVPFSTATAQSLTNNDILLDGKLHKLDYTDDTKGETLLIYTDQESYSGFGKVDIIYSISNPNFFFPIN